MKSQEIRKGDQFWHEGALRYTVLEDAVVDGGDVVVIVKHEDGGKDARAWDYDAEVPLTRP